MVALVVLALSAGCLGAMDDEEVSPASDAGEADTGEANPSPENASRMTAEETESLDEGAREGLPPFYSSRTITIEGDLVLEQLPVVLSTRNGDIDVQTGPADEFVLEVTLTGHGYTPEQATTERERLSLAWSIGEPGARELVAEVERENRTEENVVLDQGNAEGEITLKLPKNLTTVLSATTRNGGLAIHDLRADVLNAETRNGEIQIEGVKSSVIRTQTRNGATDLTDIQGEVVKTQTRNGAIEVSGIQATVIELESRNGEIGIEDTTVEVISMQTRNGEIDAELADTADVSMQTRNGDVTAVIEPATDGEVTMQTRNGHVELNVPEDEAHGYDATAKTRDGQAEILLEEGSTEREDEGEVRFLTDGFQNREIRTQLDASSRNGNVQIGPN